MKISTALSEVAAACGTKALSEDYTTESRLVWSQLEERLSGLAEVVIAREETDERFEFSPEVGFPSPTNDYRVIPS